MRLRLEYRKASELKENPKNWRIHPTRQVQAINELLQEVGWAGAVLYNERTGRLIDGHMRRSLSGDEEIPVLIGDWSEEQEQIILATLDPIGTLAQKDTVSFAELLSGINHDLAGEVALTSIMDVAQVGVEEKALPEKKQSAVITSNIVLIPFKIEDIALVEKVLISTGEGAWSKALAKVLSYWEMNHE